MCGFKFFLVSPLVTRFVGYFYTREEQTLKQISWQRLIVAIVVIAIMQIACGQQYTRVRQNGYSMNPNFTDGDVFKIEEVALADLSRGDIVLVEHNTKLLSA
jgi:hypothetical protein